LLSLQHSHDGHFLGTAERVVQHDDHVGVRTRRVHCGEASLCKGGGLEVGRWTKVLGSALTVVGYAIASSAAVLFVGPAVGTAAVCAGVAAPLGIIASLFIDRATRAKPPVRLLPRDEGPGAQRAAARTAAADLEVRVALAEYNSMRQELLSARPYMAAASAFTVGVIFLTLLATTAGHLGGAEASILLMAAALTLILGMALIAGAVHGSDVAQRLERIGDQVTWIIRAAFESVAIPPDLLGRQKAAGAVSKSQSTVSIAGTLIWLEVIGVPLAAYFFQAIAWWDFLTGRTDQRLVTFGLLLVDVVISTVYYRTFVSQARQLRSVETRDGSALDGLE
jgi:hypothetical protein